MDNEKILDNIDRVKLEKVVNELNDLNSQIWSITNILRFLYSFLSGEERKIAEPSSAMVVCIATLEYIHKRYDKLLDNILDCGAVR